MKILERELPIFKISGGSKGGQDSFAKQLKASLERRSLSSVFLTQEQYSHGNNFSLLLQTKLYDFVFIEAGEDFPVEQIRIEACGDRVQGSLEWRSGEDLTMQKISDQLVEKANDLVQKTPVWGCILIGGKSSRMGRPKHLIVDESKKTWLERTVMILQPLVDGLVVSGAGLLPGSLTGLVRLADIPGVVGPLTGILAASRWQPMVSWLFVACDMPYITTEAIRWLKAERCAGCWGRVPKLAESKNFEPLLAWYDFRAAQLFEEQLCEGNLRIGSVANHPKIDNPVIPLSLASGWKNINTPEQLGERGAVS